MIFMASDFKGITFLSNTTIYSFENNEYWVLGFRQLWNYTMYFDYSNKTMSLWHKELLVNEAKSKFFKNKMSLYKFIRNTIYILLFGISVTFLFKLIDIILSNKMKVQK